MSSKYVADLYHLADELEQDGKVVSAAIARNGGKRMERMEDLIVEHAVGLEDEP